MICGKRHYKFPRLSITPHRGRARQDGGNYHSIIWHLMFQALGARYLTSLHFCQYRLHFGIFLDTLLHKNIWQFYIEIEQALRGDIKQTILVCTPVTYV